MNCVNAAIKINLKLKPPFFILPFFVIVRQWLYHTCFLCIICIHTVYTMVLLQFLMSFCQMFKL